MGPEPKSPAKKTHPRERDVFLDASDLEDESKRCAFLDDACGDDTHLRARVEALLKISAEPSVLKKPTPWLPELTDDAQFARETFHTKADGWNPRPPASSKWKPPSPQELDVLLTAYDIETLIGKGGMGAVYKATQVSLNRPVAIKILPAELSEDSAFAERFQREARSMAALDHPNIVKIHFLGSVQLPTGVELFYIVMEYVDGLDVRRLQSEHPPAKSETVRIIGVICEALQYAHDRGFVHRDIKPANIFVTGDGVVKVGDFGLARLVSTQQEQSTQSSFNDISLEKQSAPESRLTMTGYLIGTPLFMSPERMNHQADDHRGDVYAVGMMLFELLTGSLPHVINRPVTEVIDDPQLQCTVSRALHTDPNLRYQRAQDLKADLTVVARTKQQPGLPVLVLLAATACVAIGGLLSPFVNRFLHPIESAESKEAVGGEENLTKPQPAPEAVILSAADALAPRRPEHLVHWITATENPNEFLLHAVIDRDSFEDLLNRLPPDSTLRLAPAWSGQTIHLDGGPLDLDRSLTIDASGLKEPLTFDANSKSRLMTICRNCTVDLNNVILSRGMARDEGGGIRCEGTLRLSECILHGNEAQTNGGAIANLGGSVHLSSCYLVDCISGQQGGFIWNTNGQVTLYECKLYQGHATHGGGISSDGGEIRLEQCGFYKTKATHTGGVVYAKDSTLQIVNSCFQHNEANEHGAGIAVDNSNVLMINGSVGQNTCGNDSGAGIVADNESTLDLIHCTIAKHKTGGIVLDHNSRINIESCVLMTDSGRDEIERYNGATLHADGANLVGRLEHEVDSGTQPTVREIAIEPDRHERSAFPVYTMFKNPLVTDAATVSSRTPQVDVRGYPRVVSGAEGAPKLPDLGAVELDPAEDLEHRDTGEYVVTSARDGWAVPGSLRQALAETGTGDTIRFAPELTGQTIRLKTERLAVISRNIDASNLPGGIRIVATHPVRRVLTTGGRTEVKNIAIHGQSKYEGNAVGANGYLVMEDCLITGGGHESSADTFLNRANLVLRRCVIAGNRSNKVSAALANLDGNSRLENCQITGHIGGWAMRNTGKASVALFYCTIGANDSGGILLQDSASLASESTIIASNRGGPNLIAGDSTQFVISGSNLIQNYQADSVSDANLLETDPRFAITQQSARWPVLRLLPGSPAIDAAVESDITVATDLNGDARSQDGDGDGLATPDLGAVEFSAVNGE